jgi:3-hydroxyacyl-CoA dehydrogenase
VARKGGVPRQIDQEEILERCLYPMVNEGAKILDEGIAIRASDIDVVWVNGYGWPVARGGPMYWADQAGLRKIAARLEEMGAQVSPYLKNTAEKGGKFTA